VEIVAPQRRPCRWGDKISTRFQLGTKFFAQLT
jgi:hypothetical protein